MKSSQQRLTRALAAVLSASMLFSNLTFAAPVAEKTASVKSPSIKTEDTLTRKHVGRPDVKSAAVLVVDESDSSILYQKNSKQVVPIASITKLMTALVVLDGKQDLDEVLTITKDDRDTVHGSGSRLAVGTKLTRHDMLHLALMSSENRAAHALGRNYPGGLKQFVKTMNVKAKALGMKTARFADPTGLSSKNVASASDLLRLVTAAASNSLISDLSTDEMHTVKVGKQMLQFRNTNNLVNKADWDISLQKTGYTSEAGRCLVMKTTIQDRPVVMVLLNSFGKYTRTADARRIRKWMEGNDALTAHRVANSG